MSRVTLKPSLENPNRQLLTVDRSARGSMKTAAKCVSACESQDYQMHRPVERTLRRRHYQVLSPLPDECPHQPASIPAPRRPPGELFSRARGSGRRAHWGVRPAPGAGRPLKTNSPSCVQTQALRVWDPKDGYNSGRPCPLGHAAVDWPVPMMGPSWALNTTTTTRRSSAPKNTSLRVLHAGRGSSRGSPA